MVIIVSILDAARDGIRKTHLLYSVGLSYEQLCRYVGYLKANGFVEKGGDLLRTTEKGLELIKEFESSPLTRSVLAA